jgi:hypothetical protein
MRSTSRRRKFGYFAETRSMSSHLSISRLHLTSFAKSEGQRDPGHKSDGWQHRFSVAHLEQ